MVSGLLNIQRLRDSTHVTQPGGTRTESRQVCYTTNQLCANDQRGSLIHQMSNRRLHSATQSDFLATVILCTFKTTKSTSKHGHEMNL